MAYSGICHKLQISKSRSKLSMPAPAPGMAKAKDILQGFGFHDQGNVS